MTATTRSPRSTTISSISSMSAMPSSNRSCSLTFTVSGRATSSATSASSMVSKIKSSVSGEMMVEPPMKRHMPLVQRIVIVIAGQVRAEIRGAAQDGQERKPQILIVNRAAEASQPVRVANADVGVKFAVFVNINENAGAKNRTVKNQRCSQQGSGSGGVRFAGRRGRLRLGRRRFIAAAATAAAGRELTASSGASDGSFKSRFFSGRSNHSFVSFPR